jgi:hypothetical protein
VTPEFFDAEAFQIQNDTSLPGLMRCLKARRLRQEGMTDQQVAEIIRIPVQLVGLAVQAAEERHPPINGEDLTQATYFMYEQQLGRLQVIASEPGFKHDVKGALMEGPDGRPELDTERQIQAEREISRALESVRRLMGSDAPVRRHLSIEEIGRRDRGLELLEQLKSPLAIGAVDIVDGEVVYDRDGPSLTLGDGGLLGEEALEGDEDVDE